MVSRIACLTAFALMNLNVHADDALWVTYSAKTGPGGGKNIVLVSGDEEYRSEEALPQLGKILSQQHGFNCTVLFAVDPQTGEINPDVNNNIPGLEALDRADLLILFTRFRNLPDHQMKHLVDYIESGKPLIAIRTATHAFNLSGESSYQKYSWQSKEWNGGFGKQVLGETWYTHHGKHGQESTRGLIAPGQEEHPILTGIADGEIWGPTDVYGVRLPLPGDAQPLVLGQILTGMNPYDAAVDDDRNSPMMPIAWTKSYTGASGRTARTFTSTIGSSTDLLNSGVRRLLVNASYWALGLEDKIQGNSNVNLVGEYEPLPFKFGGAQKGVRPADHELK